MINLIECDAQIEELEKKIAEYNHWLEYNMGRKEHSKGLFSALKYVRNALYWEKAKIKSSEKLERLYEERHRILDEALQLYKQGIDENNEELINTAAEMGLGIAIDARDARENRRRINKNIPSLLNHNIENPAEFMKNTQAIIDNQLGINRSSAPDGAFVPRIDVSDM